MPTSPPPRAQSRQYLLAAVAVALLAFAFYGRTIGYELTRSDDRVLIVEDANFITNPSNVLAAFDRPFMPRAPRGQRYYRPLVTLSLMFDARLTGTEPLAYHATNVALHALACALLVLFLGRLGLSLGLATAGAAIFAVHPALTEAVAWIPGRVDILLAVFSMLAFLALARWIERPRPLWLVAHALAILGALLTKEAAIVLPPAFAVFLLLERGRRGSLRRGALWAAWVVPLAIWAVLWIRVSGGEQAGAQADRLGDLFVNSPAVLMQLGKTIFPFQLAVLADMKTTNWIPGAAALLLLAAAVLWLRGRERRMALWGALVCLALLAPTVFVSDFLILENRLYLPVLAVLVVALFTGAGLLERFPGRATGAALAAVAAVVFAGYAGLAWTLSPPRPSRRLPSWRSPTSSAGW
jgi:4-amino-4-deoxy-L-arabinose transferase-like glycosyltransferase